MTKLVRKCQVRTAFIFLARSKQNLNIQHLNLLLSIRYQLLAFLIRRELVFIPYLSIRGFVSRENTKEVGFILSNGEIISSISFEWV